ncbi:hypothetical protein MIND_00646400 [Mycena indigotica]|uniref:Uncharacterized protein n=1 Tax=Mycena indigotica TaxID=2126181 RepID=A0A8H6SSL8_9AGAR|nr:uncharacterized protein MIND_00646400 [Mycena indigotica]KAF7304147.1 hypothetical protein MIND_00646400 [Mycena indigotica]
MRIRLDNEFERILGKALAADAEEDDEDEALEFEQQLEAEADRFEPSGNKSSCFPWPNETTLRLDVMDNLGHCRFTSAQISLILHIMKRLGVKDSRLSPPKETYSINFYVTNLRHTIARNFANPLVAPHLSLYPEEVVNGLVSERWQAERALDYTPEQLTPMFSDGRCRWWANEVAPLHDGRFVIPIAWIARRGRLIVDALLVTRVSDGDRWECRGKEEEIDVSQLQADFDDLITEFGPEFTWTAELQEFVPAMPNPYRKLSGDRNKSKQYNKFLVMVMQNMSLPSVLLKQEFHVHFCGASQHVTTAELNAVLWDFVQGTERDPIICFNASTHCEAAVIIRVHDKNADNPQQSEEASHIGCNGTHPCRKCKWGGSKINQVQDAVYHACHSPSIARTADEIRAELHHQLSLAAKGSAAAIETRQKETGTKDKLTQYWIERTLERVSQLKSENPRSSAKTIAMEAQNWLAEQPGDKMNPLLDIIGLDPARDMPIEILHTVLLGVIKYIWHHLNTQKWTDANRHLLAIRLQSTDITSMNIPPIHGAYMIQYRNNLIGKHFKTIMQVLVFHIHDLCMQEQFQLVKAAADLGARVWVSVIDNMEEYIADLKTAIANLLDAWDSVEPLRILTKIKLHLLPHLPDDIQQFGPAVRFLTETQESYNAVFRMCSINGNHQAPSCDIAVKFASMNNVKHALCGEWWESAATTTEAQEWVQPGDGVKKLMLDDSVLQRHLGWVTHCAPVPGFVRLLGLEEFPAKPWHQTIASQHWKTGNQPISEGMWREGLSATCKTGDAVKINGWAFVRESETKVALGQVTEILLGHNGQAWICLQQFVCTETRHPEFDWLVVQPPLGHKIVEQQLTSFLVVPGTAMEFSCSVQHDCRMGHCQPAVVAKERQERQDTTRDISLVRHGDDENFVLNLGSVHNFVELTRVLPRNLWKLNALHDNHLLFHTQMAVKARASRLIAREKTAEKQRATAAKKKEQAEEAAQKAQMVDSDGSESDLSEEHSEVDDEDFVLKGVGRKRARNNAKGTDGMTGKRLKRG